MADVPYRMRNALVLAKTETTPGQDAAPTPSANAILVDDPRVTHDLISVDTNEVTGDLDVGASIPAGGRLQFTCGVLFRGSGTANVAPPVAPLLRACTLTEIVTASAITGTAQSGGSGHIRLAASASASMQAYFGMVIRITAGAGAGQSRVIWEYNGPARDAYVTPPWTTTPDNTSQYSIDPNVTYRPGEADEPCTIYYYLHHADGANSKLTRLIGCAGTVDFEASVRNIPRFNFSMMSRLAAATDVSRPSSPSYPSTQPPPFIGASVTLNDIVAPLARIAISVGAAAQMVDDPNELYGFDRPRISERRIEINFATPVLTEAQLNLLQSWAAGTQQRIAATWGTTAGNRFAIVVPRARVSRWRIVDRDGLAYYEATMRPAPEALTPFAITYW
jgi:hypothetical protein